ncbi:MAG: energy transducer TonB [Saprospiraceae bacterium]
MKLKLILLLCVAVVSNGIRAQNENPPSKPPSELEPPPPPPPTIQPFEYPSIYDGPVVQEFNAESNPPTEKAYEMFDIEKQASFPGGELAMFKFLTDSLQYPVLALENAIQGRVILSFVVDKKGDRSEIQIIRDIGGGCGREAVRLVKSMPPWIPGEANGKKVKVRYTLPVRFSLN